MCIYDQLTKLNQNLNSSKIKVTSFGVSAVSIIKKKKKPLRKIVANNFTHLFDTLYIIVYILIALSKT